MPQFSRTWWGQRFIEALEEFTDPGRLGRGRSYAYGGRILSHQIANGKVTAKVRGSINPYFGVYKEPTYTTTIALKPCARADWTKLIADLSSKAGFVAKLLMNEMPDSIDEVFDAQGLSFLPHSRRDFTTTCSCPDYSNPCKHIAGLCYLLASMLDQDPFLLFELRGLSRDELRTELARSPLGQILASDMVPREAPLEAVDSYYTRPAKQPVTAAIGHKEFWTGPKRLPAPAGASGSTVPALVVKKQGDFPPFWKKDDSFVDVMQELYERVRTKSGQMR